MAPMRRKARPPKGGATAPASRVHKISTLDQWDSMLDKAGSRLVIVQIYQQAAWTCKQIRPYFNKFSTQFRKAIFAEIDADEANEVVKAIGVTRIPTYVFIHEGDEVTTYTGTVPNQLQQVIKENLDQYGGSDSPLTLAIKALGAIGLLAGSAFFLHNHLITRNKPQSSGDASKAAEELLDLKQRIVAARSKLRMYENGHRVKQARAQRKIVDLLEVTKRQLEKGKKSQIPGSGSGSGGGRNRKKDAKEDENWPVPAAGKKARRRYAEVLFTDEED